MATLSKFSGAEPLDVRRPGGFAPCRLPRQPFVVLAWFHSKTTEQGAVRSGCWREADLEDAWVFIQIDIKNLAVRCSMINNLEEVV